LATNYGNADYWNDRYLRYSPFDWLITFEAFKAQQLNSFMNATDAILMLGCGSAAFSADLYDDGYTNITNIDLSDVVIAQMKEANDKDRPGMTWAVMDVTSLSYENAHYDVVFDKSTMDCLFCCDDSSHIISEMMCEAWRVLKPGGLFISLSLHDVDKVLPYVDSNEQGYDLDW
jgi:SAM-dependent methyltransferase